MLLLRSFPAAERAVLTDIAAGIHSSAPRSCSGTNYCSLIFYIVQRFRFFQSPQRSGGQVVGLPRPMVRLLTRGRIQLAQAIENFLQYFTVEADQVGKQADQHDLKADDQQDRREDQRLNVPGALLERKVV